ncbi:unnamed protein product [Lactuca saligna]|uniref:Uncharacterized protein n=1 Tax=Lactuca saligna TaxID=75948 RepID=A0AA35ULY4_LACSI|nr:unnamed protein product [Lactuca saligna]
METEDIFHSTSEPEVEEIHDSSTAFVADEHDFQKTNESKSAQEDDDADLYDDVEFLKEFDFTGISDNILTNIEFDHGDEDFGYFPGIPSSCVSKVDEVAASATKTRDEGNVLKILLSISKPLEVPDVRSAPHVLSTITTTTVHSPPNQSDEGPSTMFETGRSSSIPEYSPTRPSLDEASIRLVKHLAQPILTSTRGKGISFRNGRTGDDKSSSPDLQEEIRILLQELIKKSIQMDQLTAYIVELMAKDEEKSKQIRDLQMSLGSVSANYFNLKNVLYDAFGERVKALFQQPHGIVDPPTAQSHSTADDFPINPPAPRTTTIVNRFEKELEGSRARITIKQGKRIVTANQSEGLLFKKNSNENRKAKDPVLTVTNLMKRKFGVEYGDSTHETDLAELSRAPFHNPSDDPSASNFKRFLDRQVKENFPKMKTARALYQKDKDVLDPELGKPMKIIMWPATK